MQNTNYTSKKNSKIILKSYKQCTTFKTQKRLKERFFNWTKRDKTCTFLNWQKEKGLARHCRKAHSIKWPPILNTTASQKKQEWNPLLCQDRWPIMKLKTKMYTYQDNRLSHLAVNAVVQWRRSEARTKWTGWGHLPIQSTHTQTRERSGRLWLVERLKSLQ